jgi:hypothetical protein
MNVNDIEEGLRRLLAVKSGAEEPTRLERIQLNDPAEWNDDDWEFANQRGLVPLELQSEYQRRVIERRHRKELEALQGGLPENFTGNNPVTGTATVSPPPVSQTLDAGDRLRQIELQQAQLQMEADALQASGSADDGDDAEAKYSRQTVPQLQAEISRRNADRDEDDTIEPDSQRKADLVTALVEDDEMQSERSTEPVE